MRSSSNESRMNLLRRRAKEVRRYKVLMKILAACAASVTALVLTVYAVSALYKDTGAFTISLNKAEMTQYGISLSETKDMRYKTSYLNADINEKMTCISGKSIPENVDSVDGEHNGENYIAYTFYVQNAGEKPISYEYALAIANVTNGLDEAIRVRVYVNGKPTTYAKAPNGDARSDVDADKNFHSGNEIVKGVIEDFAVGDQTKFTVVMWIHGPDPECLDFVLGGEIKLEMKMNVVLPDEEQS